MADTHYKRRRSKKMNIAYRIIVCARIVPDSLQKLEPVASLECSERMVVAFRAIKQQVAKFGLLAFVGILTSCATNYRLYPGSPRPSSEIAVLRSSSAFITVKEVDGVKGPFGNSIDGRFCIELTAGPHSLTMAYCGWAGASKRDQVIHFTVEKGKKYTVGAVIGESPYTRLSQQVDVFAWRAFVQEVGGSTAQIFSDNPVLPIAVEKEKQRVLEDSTIAQAANPVATTEQTPPKQATVAPKPRAADVWSEQDVKDAKEALNAKFKLLAVYTNRIGSLTYKEFRADGWNGKDPYFLKPGIFAQTSDTEKDLLFIFLGYYYPPFTPSQAEDFGEFFERCLSRDYQVYFRPTTFSTYGGPLARSSFELIGEVIFQKDVLVGIKNAAQAKEDFAEKFPSSQ
jgi:hypothetical protein